MTGTVSGCAEGGVVSLIPLPSPVRSTTVPFFDVRKATLTATMEYAFEAVWPGQWLVSVVCGGTRTDAVPATITVNDADPLVLVDIVVTHRRP